jgi:hypothetical protein
MRQDSNDSTQKEGGVGSVPKKRWTAPTIIALNDIPSSTAGKPYTSVQEWTHYRWNTALNMHLPGGPS